MQDSLIGKRITDDMSPATQERIKAFRIDRKRSLSRTWHSKFEKKGVSRLHLLVFWYETEGVSRFPLLVFGGGFLPNHEKGHNMKEPALICQVVRKSLRGDDETPEPEEAPPTASEPSSSRPQSAMNQARWNFVSWKHVIKLILVDSILHCSCMFFFKVCSLHTILYLGSNRTDVSNISQINK